MAKFSSRGFSLVEMLVALVFTMILMAGMATVFKSSITTFYATGEKISSMRRNRASLDLLYDDLNTAGMTLVDITSALPSNDANSNPAFYIIPNVPVAGAGAADPQTTDELYLAYDQPLAFDGQLFTGGGAGNIGTTAVKAVLTGASMSTETGATSDDAYVIDCGDSSYASTVKAGMLFQIKDDMSHAALQVADATPITIGVSADKRGVLVHVASTTSLATQVTGRGDPGTLRPEQRIAGSGIVFILPSQMVRYRILMEKLDPQNTNGVPCLVREQGTYDTTTAFTPVGAQTEIIAENVAGFKVYLSADAGADWAGQAVTATDFTSGWTNGIQAALNTQLLNVGRTDYTTTAGNSSWYRDIPIMVRLDVTTRTATQRAEYSATSTTLAYKTLTQSLVLVPRHFGLPLK